MQHEEPRPIGDIIIAFCRANNLEDTLLEHRIIKSWKALMGTAVDQMTRHIEFKRGVLYLYISNAALKQELFENRIQLLKKMNAFVGKSLVQGIKIYG